jgi:hypothetical protein
VVEAVRVALAGHQVWVGQRRFNLVVRLAEARRNDPGAGAVGAVGVTLLGEGAEAPGPEPPEPQA